MKSDVKKVSIGFLVLVGMTLHTNLDAQVEVPVERDAPKMERSMHKERRGADKAELYEALALGEGQKEAMTTLMKEQRSAIKQVKDQGLSRSQHREQVKQVVAQYDERVQAILDPAQYETYLQWRKDKKKHQRLGRRGQRK